MEWSNEASLTLIELYKNKPVLWHNRHSYYHSKAKKQEAWDSIARAMGLKAEDVRQKMNSLLGSFRREKSKIRRSEGRYALGNVAPRWFAFDKMTFLLSRHEDLPNDQVYLEDLEAKPGEEEDDDLGMDSDSNLLEEELNEASYKVPRKRAENSVETQQSPAKKIMHQSAQRGDAAKELVRDECEAYGRYVATKLMNMEKRTKALVERAINNVLFEAEMGKYDDLQPQFGGDEQTPVILSSCLDGIDLLPSSSGNVKLDQLALVPDVAEAIADT